jgi:hypothetical protein
VNLGGWLSGKQHAMSFSVTMLWRETKDCSRTSNCYICLTDVSGHTSNNRCSFEYSNLQSTLGQTAQRQKLPEKPESYNHGDNAEMDWGTEKWKLII